MTAFQISSLIRGMWAFPASRRSARRWPRIMLPGAVLSAAALALSLMFVSLTYLSLMCVQARAAETHPFAGRWQWDGPETCAPNYDSDNVAMTISGRRIVFYENTCTIRSVRKLGEGSFRLRLVCRGEGMTERTDIILARLPASKVNDDLLLRIEPKTGFVLGYRRCP